jgi:hypothetical protein
MTKRIAIAALAAALAACGTNDKCPTQSPKLSQVADCTARPGATVNYQLQLCPTCNQSGATCNVQMSGTDIFLDPTVEACTGSNSCPPPTCDTGVFNCTFTAPTAVGTYNVTVVNGDTGAVVPRTLTVDATASPSCSLVPI